MSTAQKMNSSIKGLFSKCDQIRRKLRIWSHSLKKSLMENFIFCAAGRVVGELCSKYDITTSHDELPRSVGQKYLTSNYKEDVSFYQNKVKHDYIAKSIENDPKIDHKA